jgi:hypothetical protein
MARYYSRLKSGIEAAQLRRQKWRRSLTPRFFFHVRNGSTFKDEVGGDYSSVEAARLTPLELQATFRKTATMKASRSG